MLLPPRINPNDTIITYPKKFYPLVRPAPFKIAKGGRGSAKSESFGRLAVRRAATEQLRFLCCRELQSSIKESVHQTLRDIISELKWDKFFRITDTSIKSWTGSEFIFKGLRSNYNEIKSLKGINVCWIEEAEGVSQYSIDTLLPTIRKDDAEIWVSFNPETKDSPCDKTFITHAQEGTVIVEMNWRDNPWFPMSLRKQKAHMMVVDYEKYLWVWEGQYKRYAQDVIFKDKLIVDAEFEAPAKARFYYGLDFGFSVDPLSAHRMYEIPDGDFTDLYIDYEVYGTGIELDQMHEKLIKGLPGLLKNKITADSSRPDTINHLRKPFSKNGKIWPSINCVACTKTGKTGDVKGTQQGYLKDGIDFLRTYRHIYIHKRCPGAKDDYQNYRWARDSKTQEILAEPVDKSNHTPDNNRYALEKLIQQKVSGFDAC